MGRMPTPFLTAEWKQLCLVTYAVPEEVLAPRLPPGFELDRYEGKPCVSFVAFDFQRTRVMGVPWPGFRNFPEINLRYYVRGNGRRGVMFVKELVPQRLVAWIARVTYNEPYEALPMSSTVHRSQGEVRIAHRVRQGSETHCLDLVAEDKPWLPPEGSTEHFFKEHQWGFGIDRRQRTLQYEVRHPVWSVFPVRRYELRVNFASLYGPSWGFLSDAKPISVACAVGSPIEVYRPTVVPAHPIP